MKIIAIAAVLLLSVSSPQVVAEPSGQTLVNALAGHASPYLAMHAADPVHWQLWGEEALAHARASDKPLFVSIGYFACHWCHVMQRESYRNLAIAARLNQSFVPVKVDRELQPALDAELLEFVERTLGYSGWPLNVILTPEGYPLVGFVYLPPDRFLALLESLDKRWQEDSDGLKALARKAAVEIASVDAAAGGVLDLERAAEYQTALVQASLQMADEIAGGFGDQAKFPSVPQLLALLQAYEQSRGKMLGQFLRLTLEQMASLGLRDHLGGGFFRYVTDPAWQVPHFEKMLYDNALLAELYAQAGKVFEEPRYRAVARDTLDFMVRELRGKDGGFIASLSALDGAGVEGGYYLWDEQSLESLLSMQERRVAQYVWGMTGPHPFEQGYLPVLTGDPRLAAGELGVSPDQVVQILATARDKLLKARGQRILPRDEKRLAAWNGLALMALARAAARPGGEHYRAAAREVRDFLVSHLWNGEALQRSSAPGSGRGHAALEDYAYVAWGLTAWAELTGQTADYALAGAVLEQAWRRFYSLQGWRLAEDLLIPYGGAEAAIADGPMPSPSALIVRLSLEFAEREGKSNWHERGITGLVSGAEAVTGQPFWYASQIAALSAFLAAQKARSTTK